MLKKTLVASAIMLAAVSGAHAAGSAGFGVSGTITPGACSITLGGTAGGVVGYGTLAQTTVQSYSTLAGGIAYNLPQGSLTLDVLCPTATKAELAVADNKASSLYPVGDGADGVRFGISDGTNTAAIGGYGMQIATVSLDGVAAAGILNAPNGTTTWGTTVGGTSLNGFLANGWTTGFTTVATDKVPDSFTHLVGSFNVFPYVKKTYVDAATSAITLNGSGTITLVYL